MKTIPLLAMMLISDASAWGKKKKTEKVEMDGEEEMTTCMQAHSRLNQNLEVEESFAEMLIAYNETCKTDNLCTIDVHEQTLKEMRDEESDIIPSIKGSAVAHFGENFKSHETFQNYATSCLDAGGHLECVDGHFVFLGDSTAAMFKQEESVETDVDIKILSYPVCLPTQCDDEPLDEVFEYAAKKAILKAPIIAENMSANSEALIMAATIEQVCILSGLETCYLDVEHAPCEIDEVAGR